MAKRLHKAQSLPEAADKIPTYRGGFLTRFLSFGPLSVSLLCALFCRSGKDERSSLKNFADTPPHVRSG
jgi:hypothetical protein